MKASTGSGPPKENAPLCDKRRAQVRSGTNIIAGVDIATGPGAETDPKGVVADLRSLLGDDVVLLPIPRGSKKPVIKGWQSTKLNKMQEPEYLAQLNHGRNIGVLLGHGLVTIDLDRDEAVEPFLCLNPKLRETLRSRRVRGCNLWLRIKGDCPQSRKLRTKKGEDWGEWRADGNQTVIYGEAIDHNKGETHLTAYKIVNRAEPIELFFDEVQWPGELVLPWRAAAETGGRKEEEVDAIGINEEELRKRYGSPFYTNKKDELCAINESFWAGLFAAENVLLREPIEGAFYRYRAELGIYEEESADSIKRRLSDRLLQASRQMNCFWLEKQRTDAKLNNIVAHLRGITEHRNAFAHTDRRVHLANGVFSFENGGQLLPFSSSFFSRNRCPITFDETANCPRFLNELIHPAVHEEDVLLIQKYAGLCLLGDNVIQRMLILDGESGRGKTQLANVIQAIVGRENLTQLRTRFLGDRFETFRFLKTTLLVGVDVEPNFLSTKGASVLKGLVGGDWFDAEQKNGTGKFPFQGNFCVLITSNSRLRVLLFGDIAAWRRRLLIVRYEAPAPKKKIPDFGERLVREEGSGILNWFLAGLDLVLKDVDQREDGDIALSDRQKKIVDSLLEESDSLRVFLRKRVERAEGVNLSVDEIVETYADFCAERGWQALPITDVRSSLEALMLEHFRVTKSHSIQRDGKSARGFSRVAFKS
jgi:phage/plasmid-associated DNA primase